MGFMVLALNFCTPKICTYIIISILLHTPMSIPLGTTIITGTYDYNNIQLYIIFIVMYKLWGYDMRILYTLEEAVFFFFFFGRKFRTNIPTMRHTRASRFFSPCPFCYLVRVIEFWRYYMRGVFLSCQPVKVVGRPARNTELSRGVTLEIDRSPDARAYICMYVET
jgi:hypothetical protein